MDLTDMAAKQLNHIGTVISEAVNILDASEMSINSILAVSLPRGATDAKAKRAAAKAAAQKIAQVRTAAMKTAFTHIRDNVTPSHRNLSMSSWARNFCDDEIRRIDHAINAGIASGQDANEITHSLIGSLEMNGKEGTTEVTRQKLLTLGKSIAKTRSPLDGLLEEDEADDET
jgi:hypothetical protein